MCILKYPSQTFVTFKSSSSELQILSLSAESYWYNSGRSGNLKVIPLTTGTTNGPSLPIGLVGALPGLK